MITNLTINLELINLLNLTPSAYVLLSLINQGESINSVQVFPQDIDSLIKKGLITSDLNLTKEGKSLFNTNYDQMWEEFIQLFPKKVGNRALHTKKDKTKELLIKFLKSGVEFSDIISGLKQEIYIREIASKTGEFIPAWKNLYTYVYNKSWEEYLDNDSTLFYGDQSVSDDLI